MEFVQTDQVHPVLNIDMALQYPQDVVKEVQSGDVPTSTDASVEPTTTYTSGGEKGTLEPTDEGARNEYSQQKYIEASNFQSEASDPTNVRFRTPGQTR